MRAFPKQLYTHYFFTASGEEDKRKIIDELFAKGYRLVNGYSLKDYLTSTKWSIIYAKKDGIIGMCTADYSKNDFGKQTWVSSADSVPPFYS